MFKKKKENDLDQDEIADVDGQSTNADELATGPFDAADAPDDGMMRIDFGALQIPAVNGMNVNVELEEQTQTVVSVTIVLEYGAVQLQAFAAPRTGGMWEDVVEEISGSIVRDGGQAESRDGSFGLELLAQVPARDEQGNEGTQTIRFVGVEGSRWLLRALMYGAATTGGPESEVFEDIVRGCIVARDPQPMAPGEPLPLTLPPDAVEADEGDDEDEEDTYGDLDPFERGPEITEIR